ncbi:HAMP domain-containing histidine kinase [Patescibacteria group bacterium]|nr:HAMP domain-containing histidine kinase [Patescibacteria group bacterium]
MRKESIKILVMSLFFVVFIIVGYILSLYITTLSSFIFLVWVLFLVMIFFFIIIFEDLSTVITRQLVHIASRRNKKHKKISDNSEYLSLFTHEMKNGISVIKGYVYMILNDEKLEKGLSDEVKKYLKRVDISSSKLISLTDNMLNFNKLKSGLFELNLISFSMSSILSDAKESFKGFAEEKNITIEYKNTLKDGEDIIKMDRFKIDEVVSNLLNNAINYANNNSTIYIKLEKKNADNILVSVKDEGEGIDDNDTLEIFKKFYRSSNNTKGGTGLGLYISKSIIERHKGRIWAVNNKDGRGGATFFFSLPVK